MELDDLKQQWQRADNNSNQLKNRNIMEIIQNKSNGPVAALKRSYRRQMAIMAMLPGIIISTNIQHIDKTLSSALFWAYVAFCFGVAIFARMNYNVVKKMEGMDGAVRSNLQEQIAVLEKRVRQMIAGARMGLLFLILLTEILPYFQHFKMLNTWHNLSPFIRFGAYGTLLLFQHLMIRRKSHEKFGQHIARLKELVGEMQ